MSLEQRRYLTNGKKSITIHFDTEEQMRAAHEQLRRDHPRATLEASDDGWVAWNGGECPVAPDTLVLIRTREGRSAFEDDPTPARTLRWEHPVEAYGQTHSECDVVAYKVVS